MKKRKGQIAIETLLVYGLVILVVLLALGALIKFGVLDLDKYLPDSCKIGNSALSCEEWLVDSSSSEISLVIKNTFNKPIDIDEITITSEENDITGACTWNAGISSLGVNQKTTPALDLSGCTINNAVGQKVKGKIQIEWSQSSGVLTQSASGTISATVN